MDIVTLALSKKYTEKVAKTLAGGLRYQGSKPTVADLPAASEENKGHMYTITANGHEYVSDGAQWVNLSADLDNKADKVALETEVTNRTNADATLQTNINVEKDQRESQYTQIDTRLNSKQEKLTAGTNITIDTNNVISASGGTVIESIDLTGWDETDGWHEGGVLTDAQAEILTKSEVNYIWLNGMHRLDFRYMDTANNKGTYSASDNVKTHTIEVTLSDKSWRYKHELLQAKISAGTNIVITDDKVINAPSNVSVFNNDAGYLTQHQDISGKQDVLVSGTNIKTINNASVLGSGNLSVLTYQPFPSDFKTDGTLYELIKSIKNSSGAKAGMAYLGAIYGECTPFGYGNAECKVEYMLNYLAVLTVRSSNISPYRWELNTSTGIWRKYTDVVANPSSAASNTLAKVSIDGTIYTVGAATNDIPEAPETDGNYVLKCTVSGGVKSYTWVQE